MSRYEMRGATDWQKNTPCFSGSIAQSLFQVEAATRLWELYAPINDVGLDFVVRCKATDGEMITKTVQVTTGSLKAGTDAAYCITKPINKIKEDADIIAVHIRGEHNGCNTGKAGMNDMFFLIPTEVYVHPLMYKNYYNTATSYQININKPLKRPLDVALNAWWVFSIKKEMMQEKVELFFNQTLDIDDNKL